MEIPLRNVLLIRCLIVCAGLSVATGIAAIPNRRSTASRDDATKTERWTLVWSDEFDGPEGSLPDAKKWKSEIGGNGWGNNELEYYTNRAANASVRHGQLEIQARREEYAGAEPGKAFHYTSARLSTQGNFAQAYGRFVARIKIPRGQGIWPAFWLLGDDIKKTEWPACGEIDVMENIGKEPYIVHGSLHGPGYSGDQGFTSILKLPGGAKFSDEFHLFAIEWEPGVVRFYVDDEQYATFKPSQLPKGMRWVFDHPFFILLNVAVGGDWPGSPDSSTEFPQKMLVDYVRVYKSSSAPQN